MTDASKLIIRNAAGRFAERSYFVGCSAGGQQALSEAQRYPEDYDGIVAGDPANNRIRQTFGFLSSWMATHAADGKPLFTQPKLALLTKSVVDACDALDGLKDGIIDDPRRCHFDPAKLLCKSGTDDATCLTAPQVDAAKKMHRAKNPGPAKPSSRAGRAAAKASARARVKAGGSTSSIRRSRCASGSSATGCFTIRIGTTAPSTGSATSPMRSRSCRSWRRSKRT
jgi:pimeloyl-ACP methyl ester carboxylesterase